MKIVLIGAGNVATHLGKALLDSGHEIMQVWSRTSYSAGLLAEMLGTDAVTNIDDVALGADIYIVSVTDNALPGIVSRLCPRRTGSVFLHTAGSVPMTCFEGFASSYGVLYPMQTFSKQKELDFKKIPVFVEASDEVVLKSIQTIAESVSDCVYQLNGEGRRCLHLAAVFACNFSNYCCAVAESLLRSQGIPFEVMLPLVDEMASKLHHLSPVEAQTGPASRHDTGVMKMQMSMLSQDKRLAEMYRLMSEGIMENSKTR